MNLSEILKSKGWAWKALYEYDVNGNVVYIGISKHGTAESARGWFITRFTYDVNENVVSSETSDGISAVWTDRATTTYA